MLSVSGVARLKTEKEPRPPGWLLRPRVSTLEGDVDALQELASDLGYTITVAEANAKAQQTESDHVRARDALGLSAVLVIVGAAAQVVAALLVLIEALQSAA
ncbi:hypothetical protein ACI3KX_00445 [Microbacterium sp. ZW CA_36]|uniref:hypothetical protein n=1 Tax=Microbacterium sp. ZW CA_36 TaxID=3378078 RepID=UPI0038520467